jgi:hypothetical protein
MAYMDVCASHGHSGSKEPLAHIHQLDVELPDLRPVAAPDFMGRKKRSNEDYFATG